jgi:hypothetical protein
VAYWACAQTEPKREAAATHFLGLAGYEVYCPRLRLIRPRRGRRVETRPALFPSYLFILIQSGLVERQVVSGHRQIARERRCADGGA